MCFIFSCADLLLNYCSTSSSLVFNVSSVCRSDHGSEQEVRLLRLPKEHLYGGSGAIIAFFFLRFRSWCVYVRPQQQYSGVMAFALPHGRRWRRHFVRNFCVVFVQRTSVLLPFCAVRCDYGGLLEGSTVPCNRKFQSPWCFVAHHSG